MGVETIKQQTRATYHYIFKSLSAGLGCGLGYTLALCRTAPLQYAVCDAILVPPLLFCACSC